MFAVSKQVFAAVLKVNKNSEETSTNFFSRVDFLINFPSFNENKSRVY